MKSMIDFLRQGGCVVTANNRLSRDLIKRYTHDQIAAGKQAWESPEILPWSAWLRQLRGQVSACDTVLLNAQQENLLWETVIEESPYSERLLMKAAAARACRQAWLLIHQYRTGFPFQGIALDEDAQAFSHWAQSYASLCDAQGWQDEAGLPNDLIKRLDSLDSALPRRIALAGFLQLTPQQEYLFDALQDRGIEIHRLPASHHQAQIVCHSYQDAEAEVLAAAHWARRQLESNPKGNYAVVIPKLETQRRRLQDVFDDQLLPSSWRADSSHKQRPYNMSVGQPLTDYALVDAAFRILELGHTEFPLLNISPLLRCVFIGGYAEESSQRALLDSRLRDHGEMTLRINDLHHLARVAPDSEQRLCPVFLSQLDAWQTALRGLPRRQSIALWAESISQLLQCFAWPGERALDSYEFQCLQAWQQQLEELSRLSLVSKPMSLRRAISLLRRLADAQIFQPASENQPLQVIGLLEASGQTFDALRVIGLDDEAWPASLAPNPFIPITLQRLHKLPHSSTQREYDYAQEITHNLLTSAAQVWISYPRTEADRELRISPLLRDLEQTPAESLSSAQHVWRESLRSEQSPELWQDDRGPAVQKGERVRGGTGLFQDQAACPFRAFANHRLRARPLSSVANGLDPMQRGNLVHQCLQAIWQALGDQASLLQYSDADLQSLIESNIEKVISANSAAHLSTFTGRFSRLEQARLSSLMQEWLMQEQDRAPFRVREIEQRHLVNIAGIEVSTTIDRIDELQDGSSVVIDYKTGRPRPAAWFGERPDEPQLPIYASADQAPLAAVSFAQVRRGEMAWKGLVSEEGLLPGVKVSAREYGEEVEDFAGLKPYWHRVLLQLAEQYREGNALVDPKQADTCNYCRLSSLCRISSEERGEDE